MYGLRLLEGLASGLGYFQAGLSLSQRFHHPL